MHEHKHGLGRVPGHMLRPPGPAPVRLAQNGAQNHRFPIPKKFAYPIHNRKHIANSTSTELKNRVYLRVMKFVHNAIIMYRSIAR